ncbi:hypothetical protein Pmani_035347 [Petrolisthes manimaculis]|uniref:Uncharacterized protein n=1 Tax=Petrolisthes manimaculis TaxID=1843537 RepID=A0AAE1NKP3_9EUCA|nr:hypothetical protein Pmani_035347 [Petrolisthes manimaculis]
MLVSFPLAGWLRDSVRLQLSGCVVRVVGLVGWLVGGVSVDRTPGILFGGFVRLTPLATRFLLARAGQTSRGVTLN